MAKSRGSIQQLLKSINRTGFGDLGSVVRAKEGHWIIGGDGLFPLQIEQLAEAGKYMIYSSAVRATGEALYVSLMKTMFMENLSGAGFGQYGICAGPVTITIYQSITLGHGMGVDRLAGILACHRMFMECYLEGDPDLPMDGLAPGVYASKENNTIPFMH